MTMDRRNFIKGAVAMGGAAALAGLAGCASEPEPAIEPGTYTATVPSIKGDLTLNVSFDGMSITDIRTVSCADSSVISDVAIESLTRRIVEQQNVEVDAVSGATMTSMAFKQAVSDCIEQAGGKLRDFQKGSDTANAKMQAPDEDFDLVVIGAGIAGMSAALTAARKSDLKVLLLEKCAFVGGCFRVCGGGMWTMGADINQWVGQDCSLDDYVSFMQQRSAPYEIDTELLSNMRAVAGETFMYLMENGLTANPATWTFGNPESQLPCFWSMKNKEHAWETGESGWADEVHKIVERTGVETRVNSRAVSLKTDGSAVTGVVVEDLEKIYTVNAKSVVVATGGFTRNKDYIEEFAPEYADAFAFTAGGDTGDGITMTRELDVPVVGQGMMGLFGINPSTGYYGEVGNLVWVAQASVNKEGEESGVAGAFYGDTLALLLSQTDSCAYALYDATNNAVERLEKGVAQGLAAKYDSLDELADGEGIDRTGLQEVAASRGVSQAPFYCIVQKPLFIGSIPGLKVNSSCQVENGSGEVVENLYAAGMVMFGNVFNVAYPCSGTGVGTSNYTGAVAANAILASL
ncbi:FAD-dependent oxidoreductase [Eggerthella sinensis]|uniref:FAD-dependent oxidoreductase n=1 Tax=Eggerthella sinensis TaxID=242230 RepID=UPI00248D7072|nr:FAD-dependent oxidoreductase [Eggerthella sinensis]